MNRAHCTSISQSRSELDTNRSSTVQSLPRITASNNDNNNDPIRIIESRSSCRLTSTTTTSRDKRKDSGRSSVEPNDKRHARKQFNVLSKTGFPQVSNHFSNSKHVLEVVYHSLNDLSQHKWLHISNPGTSRSINGRNTSLKMLVDYTRYNQDYKDWNHFLSINTIKKGPDKEDKKIGYQNAPYGVFKLQEMKTVYAQDFVANDKQKMNQNLSDRMEELQRKNPILNNPWKPVQQGGETDKAEQTSVDNEPTPDGNREDLEKVDSTQDESNTTISEGECLVGDDETNQGLAQVTTTHNVSSSSSIDANGNMLADDILSTETLNIEGETSDDAMVVSPVVDLQARSIINKHRPSTSKTVMSRHEDDIVSVVSLRSHTSLSSYRSTSSSRYVRLGKSSYLPRYQSLVEDTRMKKFLEGTTIAEDFKKEREDSLIALITSARSATSPSSQHSSRRVLRSQIVDELLSDPYIR